MLQRLCLDEIAMSLGLSSSHKQTVSAIRFLHASIPTDAVIQYSALHHVGSPSTVAWGSHKPAAGCQRSKPHLALSVLPEERVIAPKRPAVVHPSGHRWSGWGCWAAHLMTHIFRCQHAWIHQNYLTAHLYTGSLPVRTPEYSQSTWQHTKHTLVVVSKLTHNSLPVSTSPEYIQL